MVVRFVVLIVVLLGAFELALATDFARERLIPRYLRFCAVSSGQVMRAWGEDVTVVESTISSSRFSVDIKRGCDAVQPTALFVAAVLAFPLVSWPKVAGVFVGLLFLMVMNLIRVISLFYVGIHFPGAFDIMHHDVWQAAFIFLAVFAWGVWAFWAARRTGVMAHGDG